HLEKRTLLAVFTITNISDSGPGSFRQAILDANANPGLDTVDFSIPQAVLHTITPLSGLPTITSPIIVDGYSQPGSRPNRLQPGEDAVLLIELDGSKAGFRCAPIPNLPPHQNLWVNSGSGRSPRR